MLARGSLCALCSAILFFSFDVDVNVAEWVEMPQFSDENKIYRIPSTKQEQFFKSRRSDASVHSPSEQRNGSLTYRRIPTAFRRNETEMKRYEMKKIHSPPVSTAPSNSVREQILDSFADLGNNPAVTDSRIMSKSKLDNRSSTKDTIKSDTLATRSPSTTTQETPQIHQDTYYNHTLNQEDIMFQYLPMDILKSVHRTLQSQPDSFAGKIHFLKTFEKTLMTEIESRLARTMTPSRKARGADYYGHDDHDDHSVGFPSIEGALMAISFLTFAVYLVRLVMLLFRNMNNPMATTTAPSVFLSGKRKRSADLSDVAARILSVNMNNFDSEL